jgi:hypothetical protein
MIDKPPLEPPRFRRVWNTKLKPGKAIPVVLVHVLPKIAAVLLIANGVVEDRLWLLVPALALGIGSFYVGTRMYKREYARQLDRDNAQLEALERLDHSVNSVRAFDRKPPLAWPLFMSVIVFFLAVAGLLMQDAVFKALAILILLPTAIVWLVALRRRGVFLELSAIGVRGAGHEIPWSNVANLRLNHGQGRDYPALLVELKEPLPASGWGERMNSYLSRGKSDRELWISLLHAKENAQLICEVAHDYWGRMVGKDIPLVAMGKEVAQYQYELRKFSDRSPEEKRQVVIVVGSMFLMLAWCWHGLAASFWSSPTWSRVNWWVAAAITALGLFLLLRRTGLTSLRNQRSTAAYFVMFLFVFLMLTGFSWLIVARSLPDLVTRVMGTRREFTAELSKKVDVRNRSRSCDHHIAGPLFDGRFPSRYCPDDEELARLPQAGPMRVIVRESWFGIHIDRIEPTTPPK